MENVRRSSRRVWSTAALLGILALMVSPTALAQDGVKRIPQQEAVASASTKVQPEYPAIARQLKIQGVVELEGLIGEDGTVVEVKIVSGNPVLTKPAADALRKWKFKPFTEGGKPTRALAPFSFNFSDGREGK